MNNKSKLWIDFYFLPFPAFLSQWRQQINLIYETGYTISLVAILLSLAILGYFK